MSYWISRELYVNIYFINNYTREDGLNLKLKKELFMTKLLNSLLLVTALISGQSAFAAEAVVKGGPNESAIAKSKARAAKVELEAKKIATEIEAARGATPLTSLTGATLKSVILVKGRSDMADALGKYWDAQRTNNAEKAMENIRYLIAYHDAFGNQSADGKTDRTEALLVAKYLAETTNINEVFGEAGGSSKAPAASGDSVTTEQALDLHNLLILNVKGLLSQESNELRGQFFKTFKAVEEAKNSGDQKEVLAKELSRMFREASPAARGKNTSEFLEILKKCLGLKI